MNAVELTLPPGNKPTGVWMCCACHRLHDWNGAPALIPNPKMPWRSDLEQLARNSAFVREHAERCCKPTICRTCQKPIGKEYWLVCDGCRAAEDAAKERALFEKAEKVADDGPFFTAGGTFFTNLEAVEDHYAGAGPADDARPEYVWCAKVVTARPDWSGDALDKAHSDLHEDAADQIDREALKELDKWCDQWWDAHVPTCYEPDYSRCVLLAPNPE